MARPGWLLLCCDKLVTVALISVNFFLAGYAGAGLATAARLRYDPATLAVARRVFPRDLHLLTDALPLACLAVLALAALAVAGLAMPRWLRCFMLSLYAAGTLGAAGAEAWVAWRVRDDVQRHIRSSRRLVDTVAWYLYFVLDIVGTMHNFAWTLMGLVKDVTTNVPKNITLAERALVYFFALQVAGGVLAVAAAVTGQLRGTARRHHHHHQ